jgi:hypothetical protein
MAYYPKSQIKTNLYTNGKEYIISATGKFYRGYYYETSTGQKYTGATPNNPPNSLLILPQPIQGSEVNPFTFEAITTISGVVLNANLPTPRYLPQSNLTLPTDQDKQKGQFTRYFCKKNNEIKYLEIDKTTYDLLNIRDPQIAWDLYTPTFILWQIKGDKTQVYNSNKGIVNTAEQKLKWYGFTQYFQDKFLKYYLGS